MRLAVVSDIHSNLAAFEAVIADFGEVDEVWCLGDVVGYGPDPNECVCRLRDFPHICVAGNHDWAATGKVSTDMFNADARAAATWTGEQLTAASRDYLLGLPTRVEREGWTIVHGSPRDPIWEYVLRTWQADACFGMFATAGCFIGHSHIPLIFEQRPSGAAHAEPDYAAPLSLNALRRLVNPGSVGQPRDGYPEASYIRLDISAATIEFRRVPYDVAATRNRMLAAGLPPRLWQRLGYGV